MSENHGVIIGGNSTVNAPVAGGTNARAWSGAVATTDAREQELRQRIDQLLTALDAAVASGTLAPDVREAGEEVRQQVNRDKPSKLTLVSLLEGITTAAGSVQAVAVAATAVKALVLALL
jgi:hypothetical protein